MFEKRDEQQGFLPTRVVFISVLCAVCASALTTFVLHVALGVRTGDGQAVRADRRELEGDQMRGAGSDSDSAADQSRSHAIRKLMDSVARIDRTLRERGVSLEGTPTERKDEILASLLRITQAERQLAVKKLFAELTECGDALVPDIVALLKSGHDQDYGGGFSFGGNMFTGGYPRLRAVLIDVLRQIGTPAAKDGLLEALRESENPLDFRDLLLMYGRTADEQMVRGISEMIPGMLKIMKRSGGEEVGRLDRYVTGWIGRHNPEGTEDLLEELALASFRAGKPDGGAFAVLVQSSPERAFRLAENLHGADDGGKAIRQVASSMRRGRSDLSLSSVAQFCELVFSKLNLDETTRRIFYGALPHQLDRSIVSASERVADGKALLAFLLRRQREETSEAARSRLTYAIERLQKQIAVSEEK